MRSRNIEFLTRENQPIEVDTKAETVELQNKYVKDLLEIVKTVSKAEYKMGT